MRNGITLNIIQITLLTCLMNLLTTSLKAQHPIYTKFGLDTVKSMIGKINEIDSLSLSPYIIYKYNYYEDFKKDNNDRQYGFGILITEKQSDHENVIWSYLIRGDFPPHTFSWIDFNNDKKKDLLLLIGFEDVFVSELFINNILDNQDITRNFQLIYRNTNCYTTIIDIDKDDRPEIIEGFSGNDIYFYEIPKSVRTKINKEYDRIVGKFDKYNFTYNMPSVYKQFNLYLLSEFRILKLVDDEFVDITNKQKDHLACRKDILYEIETSDQNTKEIINNLIEFTDSIIKRK